jgi:hypothetical protein
MKLRPPAPFLAFIAAVAAGPAIAEPAPPSAAPGIVIENYGVHCNVETTGTLEAPGTESGLVNLLSGTPEFAFPGQEVPARLGISFAVVAVPDRDFPNVQFLTWKPGATAPEFWISDMTADAPHIQGFMFETPPELVTGLWRFEAVEGDTLLYRVEFEVRPGDAMPGVTSDCNLLS